MGQKHGNLTIRFWMTAVCIVSGGPLLAQSDLSRWPTFHRDDLSKWATKTGKSVRFLDELTKTATRDDAKESVEGYFPYTIENVDTQTLSRRGHILLSIWVAGTGHCMTLYILKRDGFQFEKVWQSHENLCTESILGPAKSQAILDGRLIVRFRDYSPNFDPEKEQTPAILNVQITYKWDGTTYMNTGRKEQPELRPTAR